MSRGPKIKVIKVSMLENFNLATFYLEIDNGNWTTGELLPCASTAGKGLSIKIPNDILHPPQAFQ